MEKIYFLHIPKTAGTAFNEMFKTVVPDGRYFQHMESARERFTEITNDGGPFYVSGHFPFEATKQLALRPDVFSMTILRNPVEQFISHLKWVKAYGDPAKPDRRSLIPEPIARLSIDLWETDLNDIDRLAQVLDNPISRRLFDNTQTRYLTTSASKLVDREQLDRALANFRELDFVFVLDDISLAVRFLSHTFRQLGGMYIVNSALIEDKVDFRDKRILDFYRIFVKYDAVLYTEVRKYAREKYFYNIADGLPNA